MRPVCCPVAGQPKPLLRGETALPSIVPSWLLLGGHGFPLLGFGDVGVGPSSGCANDLVSGPWTELCHGDLDLDFCLGLCRGGPESSPGFSLGPCLCRDPFLCLGPFLVRARARALVRAPSPFLVLFPALLFASPLAQLSRLLSSSARRALPSRRFLCADGRFLLPWPLGRHTSCHARPVSHQSRQRTPRLSLRHGCVLLLPHLRQSQPFEVRGFVVRWRRHQ